MPNTIKPIASIDTDLLADVQGGCGKRRRRCCGCGSKQVNIVNNYAAAPAAPAPAPAPSGGGGGWSVDVSTSYAQA